MVYYELLGFSYFKGILEVGSNSVCESEPFLKPLVMNKVARGFYLCYSR